MPFTSFWCPKQISTSRNTYTVVRNKFSGFFNTSNNTTISRQEQACTILINLESGYIQSSLQTSCIKPSIASAYHQKVKKQWQQQEQYQKLRRPYFWLFMRACRFTNTPVTVAVSPSLVCLFLIDILQIN